MKSVLAFRRLALFALALTMCIGSIQAATQIYTSSTIRYIAHWTWNDDGAGTADVELLMKAQPPRKPPEKVAPQVCIRNMKARVGAAAQDGTNVESTVVFQIRDGASYEVHLPFQKTLTSLQFIQILELPGGTCAF